MSLARFGIDPVTGFVPPEPIPATLPPGGAAWDALVPNLSAHLRAHTIRDAIEALPPLDLATLDAPAERERAFLLLTHYANAYVWGGAAPDLHIPAVLARPLCALATQLGRPPIAHYATMTLHNWTLVDPSRPLGVDNARTQVRFLGGVDEDWFFIASMGVELAGASLLPIVWDATAASVDGSDDDLRAHLEAFTVGIPGVHSALEAVRRWCDPHTYYHRVRPYVTGWPAPGVVYEGVDVAPRRYLGGSAGQSALIQSFDAVLGVHHPDAPAGAYLRAVREYMPPPHRAFVTEVERTSRVRARAEAGSPALRAAYDGAIDAVARFRAAHLRLAHDYIVAPAGTRDATGTGGTALEDFLRGAQGDTEQARLAR